MCIRDSFYTGPLGQVGYQVGVGHVPVELERLSAHISVDDERRVLLASLEVEGLFVVEPIADALLPSVLTL